MTIYELGLAYLTPVLIGLLMLALPRLSRGSTFFAVTVPAELPGSTIGRALRRRYRAGTMAATLLALAMITQPWRPSDPEAARLFLHLSGALLVVVGGLACFLHCRAQAMAFSRQPDGIRSASLAPAPSLADILPRPLWLQLLPYLTLAAACAWLALQWDRIPESVVTGMGADSTGIQPRGFQTVFSMPLLMFGTLAIMHAIMPLGLLIRRLPGHPERLRGINRLLLGMMLIVAVIGAWNSLVVLYGVEWIEGPAGMVVNLGGLSLLILLPMALLLTRRLARPGQPDEGDQTPDHCWKLGMIYFNPRDSALWVEKRFGIGYTVNFARPMAWVIIGGILAITALVLAMN